MWSDEVGEGVWSDWKWGEMRSGATAGGVRSAEGAYSGGEWGGGWSGEGGEGVWTAEEDVIPARKEGKVKAAAAASHGTRGAPCSRYQISPVGLEGEGEVGGLWAENQQASQSAALLKNAGG